MQRPPGLPLDAALDADAEPEQQPGGVGEPLGLHELLEARADRALDRVEAPPPQRLARHRVLLRPTRLPPYDGV